MLAEIDRQRSTQSSITFAHVISEWLRTADVEQSTRDGYQGYVDRTIGPAVGDVPLTKLTTRTLENLYAELRRCGKLCGGEHFVEHKRKAAHDCQRLHCSRHEYKPMAPAIGQIP
ncbi:hypothetical protein C1701_16885 [Actinoalloteichus sp. AHMU CJ021]|uniref:hypothetical protein n=1 Tax=Actinoalloteichus sp. AHMU CJ021 TaxID=2072503 RepID=UPI000CA04F53|nr:hypothetical protein C1701_16885 [Actinoalloteichus sp. AHMU CJ021]